MPIIENISLKPYNTFGVDVQASYFAEYASVDELIALLRSEEVAKVNRRLHIGGGSNLLFLNRFDGIVFHSQIKSIEVEAEDMHTVLLRVGAGMVWDELVAYCVERNYHGIENLSLIPGEVGAAAVQNIGAYGVEVKDVIERVECVDVESLARSTFDNAECAYGYRKSIFKEELKGRMVVTHVCLRLKKTPVFTLNYADLKATVLKNGGINLQNVRQTVIEIREKKLPDPKQLGNAGSFFMNPVISKVQFEQLLSVYPAMPYYPVAEDRVKIPAGWLIEQCDLKGKRFGKVAVYEKQALVIVNMGGATGEDIATVAALMQISVKKRFGIVIEPEVNYIG